MTMNRYYDYNKLEKYFGWKTGHYGRFFKKYGTLAPNIAVYCKTPVKLNDKICDVNIINVIGYGFDNKYQPDYIYFNSINWNKSILIDKFNKIFDKIYSCAVNNNSKTIIMSFFGVANFAIYYPGDIQKEIWEISFGYFYNKIKQNTNIKIKFMGGINPVVINGINFDNIGLFPNNITKVNRENTLFVNAWDPWSFVGNGNNNDNSLDGYVGRVSAVAMICSPLTNYYLCNKQNYISI
jgi:hypothetical protein